MVRSIWHRWRKLGTSTFLGWAAYRLAQRLMRLDVTRVVWLESANFPEPAGDGLAFRFLDAEEVRRHSRDPAHGLDASPADRLEGGQDFCFAAVDGERLAAYAWFALGSIEAENNRGRFENSGIAASFPEHVAFMYNGFTHPDYRGRGLYGQVNGLALRALSVHGVQSLLSTMDWTNRAARKSCARLGYRQLGFNWRWGWRNWMHTRATRGAAQYGVHFGDEALVQPRRPTSPTRAGLSCKPSAAQWQNPSLAASNSTF